ncbi:MAG: plasmid recombination protein [Leuconostoc sp.]|nr:plasmid recombination protein [Leuconostoc sp.]
MAHVTKIKAGAVAPMVRHYERDGRGVLGRENIDETRSWRNYNLCPSDVRARVADAVQEHERTAGKAIRSDANVLFDWVVTLPKDCPEEKAREFFQISARFIGERYGEDNVLGAYVHMDETTPHMHVPVVPRIGGKLQCSKMLTRADLRAFHGDLQSRMDEELGMHVSCLLEPSQAQEKALSAVPQAQLDAARAAIQAELAAETERLERLRCAVEEREEELQGALDQAQEVASLPGYEEIGARSGQARERIERAGRRAGWLGERIAAARDRLANGEAIARGIEQVRAKIEGVRAKIEAVKERLEPWQYMGQVEYMEYLRDNNLQKHPDPRGRSNPGRARSR